jgi:hypothetical protein
MVYRVLSFILRSRSPSLAPDGPPDPSSTAALVIPLAAAPLLPHLKAVPKNSQITRVKCFRTFQFLAEGSFLVSRAPTVVLCNNRVAPVGHSNDENVHFWCSYFTFSTFLLFYHIKNDLTSIFYSINESGSVE